MPIKGNFYVPPIDYSSVTGRKWQVTGFNIASAHPETIFLDHTTGLAHALFSGAIEGGQGYYNLGATGIYSASGQYDSRDLTVSWGVVNPANKLEITADDALAGGYLQGFEVNFYDETGKFFSGINFEDDGSIQKVDLVAGGSGYLNPTVIVTGVYEGGAYQAPSGTGAYIKVKTLGSGLHKSGDILSIPESGLGYLSGIYHVDVVSGGSGYTQNTVLLITGSGGPGGAGIGSGANLKINPLGLGKRYGYSSATNLTIPYFLNKDIFGGEAKRKYQIEVIAVDYYNQRTTGRLMVDFPKPRLGDVVLKSISDEISFNINPPAETFGGKTFENISLQDIAIYRDDTEDFEINHEIGKSNFLTRVSIPQSNNGEGRLENFSSIDIPKKFFNADDAFRGYFYKFLPVDNFGTGDPVSYATGVRPSAIDQSPESPSGVRLIVDPAKTVGTNIEGETVTNTYITWKKDRQFRANNYEVVLDDNVENESYILTCTTPDVSGIDYLVSGTGSSIATNDQDLLVPLPTPMFPRTMFDIFKPYGAAGVSWSDHTIFLDEKSLPKLSTSFDNVRELNVKAGNTESGYVYFSGGEGYTTTYVADNRLLENEGVALLARNIKGEILTEYEPRIKVPTKKGGQYSIKIKSYAPDYNTPSLYSKTVEFTASGNSSHFDFVPGDAKLRLGGTGDITTSGPFVTTVGGSGITAVGTGVVVVGGINNRVTGELSALVGGSGNRLMGAVGEPGEASFMGGGRLNIISGHRNVLVGGEGNYISGDAQALLGGRHNSIFGGTTNLGDTGAAIEGDIDFEHSMIGGGQLNAISGDSNFVGGGYKNSIGINVDRSAGRFGLDIIHNDFSKAANFNTLNSAIAGGRENEIYSSYGFIGGGYGNRMYEGDNQVKAFGNAIVGGRDNTITGDSTLGTIILGGKDNQAGALYNIIGGFSSSGIGDYGLAIGRNAASAHQGAFVLADSTIPATENGSAGKYSHGVDTLNLFFDNGTYIRKGGLYVSGDTTITGNLNVSGSFTLGDTTTDTLTSVGEITTSDYISGLSGYFGKVGIGSPNNFAALNGVNGGEVFRVSSEGPADYMVLERRFTSSFKRYSFKIQGAVGDEFKIRDVSLGADRFTIDGAGKIGIGLEQPEAKLHVNGDASITGELKVNGEVHISNNLVHKGDTDTYLNFNADRIRLNAGGVELIDAREAGTDYVAIGGVGSDPDVNFLVGSAVNGIDYVLEVDAGTSTVGINCDPLDAKGSALVVSGDASITGALRVAENIGIGVPVADASNTKFQIKQDTDDHLAFRPVSTLFGSVGLFAGGGAGMQTLNDAHSATQNFAIQASKIALAIDGNYGGLMVDALGKTQISPTQNVAPQAMLVVSGDASITGELKVGDAHLGEWPANGEYAFFGNKALDHSAGGNYALLQRDVGDTFLNAANGRTLYLRINNQNALTVASNSKVGIGTTNPAAPLEIYSSNNETLRVTASDSQQASIGFAQGATNKWLVGVDLNANGSEDFFIYDANAASNRLIIDNAGNVGIGTSNPGAKLEVYDGDSKFEVDPDNNRIRLRDNAFVSGNLQVSGDLSAVTSGIIADEGGYVSGTSGYFGKAGIGSSTIDAGVILQVTKTDVGDNEVPEVIKLSTLNSASPTWSMTDGLCIGAQMKKANGTTISKQPIKFRYDGGDMATTLEEGKVGIGTSSPGQTLHVNSAGTNFVAKFESTDDKASILIEDDTTLNYIHSRNGYFSLGGASDAGATNLTIISAGGSAGSVGIGVTSPEAKLQVSGDASITGDLSVATDIHVADNLRHLGDSDTRIVWGDDRMRHYAGSVEMIDIREAGADYVAIGGLSSSSSDVNFFVNSAGAGGTDYAFAVDAGLSAVGINVEPSDAKGSALVVSGDASITGQLRTAGKVGIGDTAALNVTGPFHPIHVSDASDASILIDSYTDTVGTSAKLYFRTEADDSNVRVKGGIFFERLAGTYGNGIMRFAVDSAGDNNNVGIDDSKMVIDRYGNVLIGEGVGGQGAKLTVSGDASITGELKVGTDAQIGTSVSTSKLAVNTAVDATLTVQSHDNNENVFVLMTDHAKQLFNVRQSADAALIRAYKTNGASSQTETIALDADSVSYITGGNLAVGTTTSDNALSIVMPSADSSNLFDSSISDTNAALSVFKAFNNGSDDSDVEIGKFGVARSRFGASTDWAGHFKFYAHGGVTTPDFGSERFRLTWDGNGRGYFGVNNDKTVGVYAANNKVQITSNGTQHTAPQATLTVSGDASITGETRIAGSVGIGTADVTNPNGFSTPVLNVRAGSTNQGSAIYVGSKDTEQRSLLLGQWGLSAYVYNRAGGPLRLGTNNSEKIRITSEGNTLFSPTFNHEPQALVQISGDASITGELRVGTNTILGAAGSVAPVAPLTVKSSSTSSEDCGITLQGSSNSNPLVKIAEKSTDGGRFHMYDGGVEKIAFYTDGTNNHISAGNVGIGTTDPNNTLHVHTASAGSVTADTDRDDLVIENSTNVGLTFLSPNTDKAAIAFGDPQNSRVGLITYDHAHDSLAIRANNTDNLLTVQSGGEVGVGGTGQHGALFTVHGDASITGELRTNGKVALGGVAAGRGSFTDVVIGDPTSDNTQVEWYEANSSAAWSLYDNDRFSIWANYSSSWQERFFINLVDGSTNVTGDLKVSVGGAGNIVHGGGGGVAGGFTSYAAGGINAYALGMYRSVTANNAPDIYDQQSDSVIIGAVSDQPTLLVHKGNGVKDGGTVGIGDFRAADPQAKLVVSGAASITGELRTAGNIGVGVAPAHKLSLLDSAVGAFINPRNSQTRVDMGAYTDHDLALYAGENEQVRIDKDGNVGIGTTDPSANGSKTTLHINSDSNGAAIRLSQASNSSLIRYDDTNGLQVGTIASKNLSFETADTTAITINTSQNVGIATTAPTGKLHIYQSGDSQPAFLVEGSQGSLFSVEDTLTGSLMSVNDIAGLPVFEAFDDGTIVMGQYNSGDLVVTGNKVGIGTRTPTSSIQVKGNQGTTFEFTDSSNRSLTDLGAGVLSWNAAAVLGTASWGGTADIEIDQVANSTRDILNVGDKFDVSPVKNQIRLRDHAYVSGNLYVSGAVISADDTVNDHISGLSGYFGRIGIGTTAINNASYAIPDTSNGLQIWGNDPILRFQSEGVNTDHAGEIQFAENANLTHFRMYYDGTDAHGNNGALVFGGYGTAATDEFVVIDRDGKVSIGAFREGMNSVGQATLTVSGDASVTGQLKVGEGIGLKNGYSLHWDNENTRIRASHTNQFMGFDVGGTSNTIYLKPGKVGINWQPSTPNSMPSATLSVSGDASITGELKTDGNVGINADPATHSNTAARNLVIKQDSTGGGITISTATNAGGNIYFADGTAGDSLYRGYLTYNHTIDTMIVGAAADTRFAVDATATQVTGDLRVAQYIKHGGDEHTYIDFTSDGIGLFAQGKNLFVIDEDNGKIVVNENGGDYNFQVESEGNENMIFVDAGNNLVGFGTPSPSPSYTVTVSGGLAADYKSFIIDHPDPAKPNKQLAYASSETPEHNVFVRGKAQSKIIELPDHWPYLVHEDSISVQLTPIGEHQELYVESIKDNKILINNSKENKINCFYLVHAERKDIGKLEIEPDKSVNKDKENGK